MKGYTLAALATLVALGVSGCSDNPLTTSTPGQSATVKLSPGAPSRDYGPNEYSCATSISPSSATITVGQTYTFSVLNGVCNYNNPGVILRYESHGAYWGSGPHSVATVPSGSGNSQSSSVVVTSHSVGSAIIDAYAGSCPEGSCHGTATLTVEPAPLHVSIGGVADPVSGSSCNIGYYISDIGGGAITSYLWETSGTLKSPSSESGAIAAFPTAGNHWVQVTVTDEFGRHASGGMLVYASPEGSVCAP
jgi:hypothetical protein